MQSNVISNKTLIEYGEMKGKIQAVESYAINASYKDASVILNILGIEIPTEKKEESEE